MISSDLKGNHTYCKPKCKTKCQPFMLFHLHHIYCNRMCAGETQNVGSSLYFPALNYVSASHHTAASLPAQHFSRLYSTLPFVMTGFWQNSNTQTEMGFWMRAPFVLYFVVNMCFAVCKVSTRAITVTLVSVQWCWRVVNDSERFGITVLLRRGWENTVAHCERLSPLLVLPLWWFVKWKQTMRNKIQFQCKKY